MQQPHNFVQQRSQTSEGTSLRFVYFGTPNFSTFVLEELAQNGFRPLLVVTAPDKPAGRGLALLQSPVKKWALSHSVEILQPEKFDDEIITRLAASCADFGIVAAYGKILPQRMLDLFPRGMLNVHPSLLPRYRGTSPVESQILADDSNIGVTIILMDEKMDHGPIVAQEKVLIPNWPVDRNTANEIFWRAGGKLLADTLLHWLAGEIVPIPQDEAQATVTKKIVKEDGQLDLTASPRANYLKYLAYQGWPGTYFFSGAEPSTKSDLVLGKRVKITKASFVNGVFIVERVIPEGKREMDFSDYNLLRG